MVYVQQALLEGIEPQLVRGPQLEKQRERQLVGRVLHLGGGVQSSTLVEMVVEGVLKRPDIIIYADTGNDPDYVKRQIKHLNNRLSTIDLFIVQVARSADGIVKDLTRSSGRFASIPVWTKSGPLRRQCTAEYKIKPIRDYILNWLVYRKLARTFQTKKGARRRVKPDIYIESWFGFTTDEAYRIGGGQFPKWQQATYPLFEMNMSRGDCRNWLIKHNLPVPNRSACIICPYRSDHEWKVMQVTHPRDFGYAEGFDEWLRSLSAKKRLTKGLHSPVYLHRSCRPLGEAIDALQQQQQLPGLPDLCAGSCWT